MVINFLHLVRPEIIIKEFIILRHPRDDRRLGVHNSNTDICKKAVDHKFNIVGGYSAEFYGWTANIGTSI